MTACVIDGQRCTKCCQAIYLNIPAHDVFKKIRQRRELSFSFEINDDLSFVDANWTNISWRRAKKKNPYLAIYWRTRFAADKVKRKSKINRTLSYWVCRHITPTGCGVYSERPGVCSGFPRYRNTPERWNEIVETKPAEYHPDCTEHVAVIIDPRNPASGEVLTKV